jgi:hypothetical protein
MKKLILSILLAIIAVGSTGCVIVDREHHHDRRFNGPPVIVRPVPGPHHPGPPEHHGRYDHDRR